MKRTKAKLFSRKANLFGTKAKIKQLKDKNFSCFIRVLTLLRTPINIIVWL